MMKAFSGLLALAAAALPANVVAREQPATLHGTWRVGPVVDPSRQPLPSDLAAQLAHAHLPMPGGLVRAERGTLCVGSSACRDVAWTTIKLADFEDGPRYKLDFGLSAQASIYQGDTGDRLTNYTLIVRPDRTFMAVVILCQDSYRARGCHNAYEVWRPASADAIMMMRSSKR